MNEDRIPTGLKMTAAVTGLTENNDPRIPVRMTTGMEGITGVTGITTGIIMGTVLRMETTVLHTVTTMISVRMETMINVRMGIMINVRTGITISARMGTISASTTVPVRRIMTTVRQKPIPPRRRGKECRAME
jgi:hypothetical protein